jgi:L-seryl-tRNA(Ser) seleniumtransferase
MPETANALQLRSIPSVDELLRTPAAAEIAQAAGVKRTLLLARDACDALRQRILENGVGSDADPGKEAMLAEAASILAGMWTARPRDGVRRVINATGVIVHTNLGRSRLSENAMRAIADAAGYCTLEYDLGSGKRGSRGAGAERMICELTGAEGAVIVNNCAAAAFLVLTVFAKGNEVIVSRGELVEIGGDFRVPDVMAQSGAVMREVGTTNRTKLRDYETALSHESAMIMRVHPSNYRIIGFTETARLADLAELSRSRGVILFEDAGSGALTDLSAFGLGDEPLISRSIADGADLVAFSGDKLLGGPQAGIIAGRAELIDKIQRHPLYRALRVDKLAYAALEATLSSYLRETQFEEVPTMRTLAASQEDIRERAEKFVASTTAIGGVTLSIVEGESVIGGGSAPDVKPRTALIAVEVPGVKAEEVEARLRAFDVPVIARIEGDRVVLDLRTMDVSEEVELSNAIEALSDRSAAAVGEVGHELD